ncbi:sensor histidine kinase [Deinococcus petrolearius]|uniref:histidine kinase n=1 Tax=Deinococcus petrolearius TaxID=1751295 RepID=A0ABW1DKJ2_9DEIO
MNKLTAPKLLRGRGRRASGWWPLRTQFTLVIFLLTFLPNLTITLPTLLRGAAPTWLPLWMVAVGGVSALTGYVLSGALLRPLHRLEAEVVSGGVSEPHGDDPAEIRALRGAFAGLLARLGTEQSRRSAFMATLVHDLKTPLIATGHLTRLLTSGGLPEAERRGVGEQMTAETERLLALVGQMADAHRYEREDVQLRRVPTDLRALLDGAAQRLGRRAAERGLNLKVCGQGEAPVDAAALERAVVNLGENALRYARHTVRLSVVGAGVQVQDDGPGLAAPLSDLAQPFNAQPATIAGQQYTAGTAGLGLFIARRIAEAHGGELRYSRTPPDPPGSGLPPPAPGAPHLTTFTLCLPEVSP